MKRFLILFVLGFMFISMNSYAYKTACLSCVADTSIILASAAHLGVISVGNSSTTVQRIDIWDSASGSGTYLGSIAVPGKSTRTFKLQIRLTAGLVVFCSSAHLTITTGHESTAYGHYPYGVMKRTDQNTPYSSPGELVGVLMANWDTTDTGRYCIIQDSYTTKVLPTCPAHDSIYIEIDRIRFNNIFQVQLEYDNVSIMIIRRWN